MTTSSRSSEENPPAGDVTENTSSQLVFDAVWLAGCEQLEIDCSDGITTCLLFDSLKKTHWITRCAPLTASASCERLRHELAFASRVQPEWGVSPCKTIWSGQRLICLYPATATTKLASMLTDGTLSLDAFFSIATAATKALSDSHLNGTIHGDVRPSHLVVDGSRVRLIGFDHVSPGERISGPAMQPFLAPELARNHETVDRKKADLYALGVTLYALLTGELPLHAESETGWQHAHSAIQPLPAQSRRADVPLPVGAILSRLMAKDPSERYATAASVFADLQRCRGELLTLGHVADFAVDAAGPPRTLNHLVELFGRASEKAALVNALQRVSTTGEAELVLISGGGGSGKSALADWLLHHEQSGKFRFASGKSDQSRLNVPYAPVSQVIRGLTMALLGDEDDVLADIRENWISLLDGQGRAIAELVPEVEHVLGPTAPLSNVAGPQAQARLERAILQTLAAFARGGMPLVILIDDLQWAGAATIGLLKAFVATPPHNVLVLSTYREFDDDASFSADLLAADAVRVTHLQLRALSPDELTELVGAALNEPSDRIGTLAQAVHLKTGGNPFFSWQLLRALIDDGVLIYDVDRAEWNWNEREVAHRRYSDDVIDLMIRRLDQLPRDGAELVKQLACIGSRSEGALLAQVCGIEPREARDRLQPFVQAGLIVEERGVYVFQHDRVLESAYAMIPPEVRPGYHAHIASVMVEYRREQIEAFAFEICGQIERAVDCATDDETSAVFAHMLILAGKHARNAAALNQATHYADVALRMMNAAWWSTHYDLAYAAHLLQCECLLAQADLVKAASEIDSLLARPLPVLDKAAVHRLKAVLQTVRSDYEGAMTSALSGLSLLDVHLQRAPTALQMRASYDAVQDALGGRAVAELNRLPVCEDRRIQIIMGLLSTLTSSFFVIDGLGILLPAKMVELTLEHGVTPESPIGLAWFGVFIASLYDASDEGLGYALAALAQIDRHGYEAQRVSALVALDQVSVWTRPLSYALGQAQEARRLGRASGDIGMACYACNHIASDLLAMGQHLRLVDEEIELGLELTRIIQYEDIELILRAQQDFARQLREDFMPFGNKSNVLPGHRANAQPLRFDIANSEVTRFFMWLYDGMGRVFSGDYQGARQCLAHAASAAWVVPAHINIADCRLFSALALAHDDATSDATTDEKLAELQRQSEQFARWAQLNATTFRNKLLLIDAEIARLQGDYFRALVAYEQSSEAAVAAGFIHEQALAHEFAGALCKSHGLDTSTRQHLRSAIACYKRWGADQKAAQLGARYPHYDLEVTGADTGQGHWQQRTLNWELGFETAKAMSGEVVMERLVETLMTSVIVRSGAQHGLLLLMHDDGPRVEASARVIEDRIKVVLGSLAPSDEALPLVILNSVIRTREKLVLADASVDAPSFRMRRHADSSSLRSVLCLPLVRGQKLVGIIYLENNLAPAVFDADRIAELEVLAPQVAISLETARLYEQLIDENERRLNAEMSLRAARAELGRTSRLTLMGNLAASIAHEVNQPLMAIAASSEASLRWLNRATPNLEEVQTGLMHIKRTSIRAAEIIRALRSLAKQSPSVLASLRLDELVRDVLDIVRLETDAQHVMVVTRLDAGEAVIEADRAQLQQVVLNLLTNAIEAMSDMPAGRRTLVIASRYAEGEVMVSVQDQGSGIPADVLERVFDPFFTTKASGMGMGLAICRSIIEAHHGTLEAHSKVGAEFVFRLPASPH